MSKPTITQTASPMATIDNVLTSVMANEGRAREILDRINCIDGKLNGEKPERTDEETSSPAGILGQLRQSANRETNTFCEIGERLNRIEDSLGLNEKKPALYKD